MIKWKGTIDGRETVGMCLEEGNIRRLLAGDPIRIRAEDMDLPFDILIDFALTQEVALQRMKNAGAELPPEEEWKR